jgi:DNA replication factor GINS
MYNELHEVWKRELENRTLEKLSPDFYSRIVDYLRKLKEETRMLDKRTVKASLLKKELQNVKHMINDICRARYGKIHRVVAKGEKVQPDVLTIEEERIFREASSSAEAYWSFVKSVLRGYVPKTDIEREHKRAVLRFLKSVPAIIGADMKAYGPFKAEDVASLPTENAKVLIKQDLAEKVEAD